MAKLGLAAGRPSAAKKPISMQDASTRKVRVNFDLDETAHIKLKMHAVRHSRTVADVLRDLIWKLPD